MCLVTHAHLPLWHPLLSLLYPYKSRLTCQHASFATRVRLVATYHSFAIPTIFSRIIIKDIRLLSLFYFLVEVWLGECSVLMFHDCYELNAPLTLRSLRHAPAREKL